MAVFGEAIFGHVGEYKARVYSAQYVRSEDGRHHLVNAGGLTEQDTLNKMFGRISIGPQNDSAFVLALNTEMKGYSWAVRTGHQTNSRVSGGYCHAVHSESKLSSMHEIDSFLYFPFIPDGDYCVSLIRNPGSFNAQDRWQRNMQSVSVLRDNYNEELGRPLNIPAELMKRLTAYIISQSSVNSRQYLYIRVPDRAPYEAYCLAALHDILSHIPAGLRAGISAAFIMVAYGTPRNSAIIIAEAPIMGGMIFNLVFMAINAGMRGFGKTQLTFVSNMISCVVNICFNYLLIQGHCGFPALGIKGAAIATVAGTIAACIFMTVIAWKRDLFVNIPYCIEKKYKITMENTA